MKIFILLFVSSIAYANDPNYVNDSQALNLKSDSYCMDGFGVIQDNSGCKKLSIIKSDDDETDNSQCLEKTTENTIVNSKWIFVPVGAPLAVYTHHDLMCADGSFLLLRDQRTGN